MRRHIEHARNGLWKAEIARSAPITIFAESDPYQAEIINRVSGKAVICPAAGKTFLPVPIAGDIPPRPCCK